MSGRLIDRLDDRTWLQLLAGALEEALHDPDGTEFVPCQDQVDRLNEIADRLAREPRTPEPLRGLSE